MSIDTWTPAAPVGSANHESDNVVKMDEWTNDMANGTVGANQSTQPDGLKGAWMIWLFGMVGLIALWLCDRMYRFPISNNGEEI